MNSDDLTWLFGSDTDLMSSSDSSGDEAEVDLLLECRAKGK